jgi:hypothetical protein
VPSSPRIRLRAERLNLPERLLHGRRHSHDDTLPP